MAKQYTLKNFKNKKLSGLIQSEGFDNVSQFSKHSGIVCAYILPLLNLSSPVILKYGVTLSKPIIKLSDYFGVYPEEIIPEEYLYDCGVKTVIDAQLEIYENQRFEETYKFSFNDDFDIFNYYIFSNIMSEKLYFVIKKHYYEDMSFTEIAKLLNVTPSYIQRLHEKCLRILRRKPVIIQLLLQLDLEMEGYVDICLNRFDDEEVEMYRSLHLK